ncbi:MAG: protein-glutamate O-methyltransferase CheR [Desulfobacterales bacterium]|nr:protein-glutamate O-methyltransferase CheR [Desulfobacterales bacterium]
MEDNLQIRNDEFVLFQKLIYDLCGIYLSDNKKALLTSRLGKRLKELGCSTFRQYREYVLTDKSGQELTQMLDAISTNKTEFLREKYHFEFLERHLFPDLLTRHRVRFWCAGCSSGEEPYTLAISILEHIEHSLGKDIKILATDISTTVLKKAQEGVYQERDLAPFPVNIRRKYFLKGETQWEGYYMVKESLREIVYFRYLNLMTPFPFQTLFDVIFCRNVLIYFDKPTQANLIEKFFRVLSPGGYLFIGHSESLSGIQSGLTYVEPAIYKKLK